MAPSGGGRSPPIEFGSFGQSGSESSETTIVTQSNIRPKCAQDPVPIASVRRGRLARNERVSRLARRAAMLISCARLSLKLRLIRLDGLVSNSWRRERLKNCKSLRGHFALGRLTADGPRLGPDTLRPMGSLVAIAAVVVVVVVVVVAGNQLVDLASGASSRVRTRIQGEGEGE